MTGDLLLRLLVWIIDRTGRRTLLELGLLMAGLSSAVLGLTAAVRGVDFGLLISLSILSLLFGWWLARTGLSAQAGTGLLILLGMLVAFSRVGRLGSHYLGAARSWAGLIGQGWPWRTVDWNPFLQALDNVWGPVKILSGRLFDWLSALAGGGSPVEPVAVALVWSLAAWAVAGWAGWAVRRRRDPLLGLAPAGALLAASLSFAHKGISSLLLFLASLLLLKFVVDLEQRERKWQANGMDYPEDIRFDQSLIGVSLTLALVATAALAPSLSLQKMSELAQRLAHRQTTQASRVGEALGLERSTERPRPFTTLYAPGLPRRHLIGAGPELSQQVVMVVRTGDLPSGLPEPAHSQPVPRYYWRGLTYDHYTGRGWATTRTETSDYPAQAPAVPAELPSHRRVDQEVQLKRLNNPEGNLVFVAGKLAGLDQEYRVDRRMVPTAVAPTGPINPPDESSLDMFGATVGVESYRASSQVPVVGAEQLRQAGSAYPGWIQQRYLQLPEGMPARVLSLARDLTATQPTPYDRAKAIEAYLRTFPYTLELPRPPANRDVADYFLFELQKGYCDYYASAMVVLARAAGLPARLVMGYATGEYDAQAAAYIVTEANGHSWPEIYFPGYGWVEFEPTAGQPALERPEGEQAALPELHPGEDTSALDRQAAAPGRLAWLRWAGILLAALVLLGLLWLLFDFWHLMLLPPTTALAHLFRRLYRRGRSLAVPVQRGDTPYEYAQSFTNQVEALSKGKRWERAVQPTTQEVGQLTDLYTRAQYSPSPPDQKEKSAALRTWQRLRWRLWLVQFLHGFEKQV